VKLVKVIGFRMPAVFHAFRRGHRIMIHIQSSWFPLVDRNPQIFVDIPNARPEDFRESGSESLSRRRRRVAHRCPCDRKYTESEGKTK
jgi:predicted acyl esterase